MAEGVRPSPNGSGLRFKVRGPREFYGGLALIALAIVAIWASGDLPGMHGFAFGPGTAPRLFASLLAICGAMIALSGLLFDGPPLDSYAIRGPAWVILAILAFAGMIRGVHFSFATIPPLGLIPSTFAAFMISIFGSSEMRWIESLMAATAMTAFCVALFVYLLQLPFQLWPWY
ncbi:MAG TPA: tripartite tricarboxylate transporter TctB family protein [Pseudolabrys sp.]|nr:tripartite tricarboxylate transporter TctB family protein [Pseudolabrys sp.]